MENSPWFFLIRLENNWNRWKFQSWFQISISMYLSGLSFLGFHPTDEWNARSCFKGQCMRVSKGVYEELIAFAKEHDISGPVVPAKWFKNAFGSQIFLCCRSAMWKWKEIAYTAKDSPCAPVAHAGNSQRIFVIAVLFLLSLVRKTLLPSEEKATGGVSPDEQLLFWRRVLGQMKVIAVQRELQLNDPGDLAAILRLGILLRFSFLRQKSKKSDSHVRILSRQSVCRWLENRSQILSIWQILGTWPTLVPPYKMSSHCYYFCFSHGRYSARDRDLAESRRLHFLDLAKRFLMALNAATQKYQWSFAPLHTNFAAGELDAEAFAVGISFLTILPLHLILAT